MSRKRKPCTYSPEALARRAAYNKAYQKAIYAKNKEERKALSKQYYHENKEKCRARIKAYALANPKVIKRLRKKRYWEMRSDVLKWNKRQADTLSDYYVRKFLSYRSGVPAKTLPAELVKAKRVQLKIARYIKTHAKRRRTPQPAL